MYRQIVSGIGGHHEFPPPHTRQIRFAHHPQHPLLMSKPCLPQLLPSFCGTGSREIPPQSSAGHRTFPFLPAIQAAAVAIG
jgi:hypothetical protein